MDFYIDAPPPTDDEIVRERDLLSEQIKGVKMKDMIVTAIIVIATSTVVAFAVYWLSDSVKYAAISASIYPLISVVLNLLGVTTNTGFRSATMQLIELNNNLINLKPVASDNPDIEDLRSKYPEIASYVDKVREMNRDFVNGELASFWEYDAGTQAKTARARNWVNKARKSREKAGKQPVEKEQEFDGFVLDDEQGETEK